MAVVVAVVVMAVTVMVMVVALLGDPRGVADPAWCDLSWW